MNTKTGEAKCWDGTTRIGATAYRDRHFDWWLCDSWEPSHSRARTVLVSSPRADIYNEFKKTASVRYMPVWSSEELEDCRQRIYGNQQLLQPALLIQPEHLKAMAELCGPIPRLVFKSSSSTYDQQQAFIRDIDGKLPSKTEDLMALAREVHSSTKETRTSHFILHTSVHDPFFDETNPGSGYIISTCKEKL